MRLRITIAIRVFFFVLLFLLVQIFGRTAKSFFRKVSSFVTQKACDQGWSYFIGHTKKSLRSYCWRCYLRCVWLMLYLIHSNQYSQHPKSYKNKKPGNKMEGNTENSTVQGTKNSEVELISSKVWRKRKEKVFKRKNWLIHSVKVMLILLLKNLFHYQKI